METGLERTPQYRPSGSTALFLLSGTKLRTRWAVGFLPPRPWGCRIAVTVLPVIGGLGRADSFQNFRDGLSVGEKGEAR